MLESQATLKKRPAADLMSIFPEFYVNKYRNAHYTRPSWAANINHRLIERICRTLRHEPYLNILSAISKNYKLIIEMVTGPIMEKAKSPSKEVRALSSEFDSNMEVWRLILMRKLLQK